MRRVAFLFSLLAGSVVAQDPLPIGRGVEVQLLPEVTSRLASQNPATVAWGAHLAAKHRVGAAVPEIKRALARFAPDDAATEATRELVALALLDALVQNGAPATAEELAPFWSGPTRAPAYVLLGRDGKANAALYLADYERLDENGARGPWLAAGALLAGWRDPGLVTRILDRLEYQLSVQVTEPGSGRRAGGGMIGGGFTVAAPLQVPDDFPPTALYELVATPVPGDQLFLAGVDAVHVRRVVATGRAVSTGHREPIAAHTRQATRVRWLAEAMQCGVHELGSFVPAVELEWRDAATLRADVARTKAELDAKFAALQHRCREQSLDRAAAPRPVRIRTRVVDLRERDRSPLPVIE